MRIFIALALNFALTAPALALDRVPPAQRTGHITIVGSGSTGDVSGTSVFLLGGASGLLGRVLPVLDITRAEIASQIIPVRSFTVSGFAAAGDAGAGARYVRGISTGPMAVQDAAGTWWQLDLSAPTIPAGWFGLLPSNTAGQNDAASAKAVAALGALGGGILAIPCGNYQFASGVDNNAQGVLFRGPPAPNSPRDAGSSTACAQFVATQSGTLFKHRTPYGQGYSKFVGGGIQNISLLGSSVATRLLEVDTVNAGIYDGYIAGAVGREAVWFHSGVSRTDVADSADVQHAHINLTCRQIDGTAASATDCFRFDGSANANFSFNEDVVLRCQFSNGNCITGVNADNNKISVYAFRARNGSGRAVYAYAINSSAGSVGFDNNFFAHFNANAPSYVQGMGDAGATGPVKNEIAFLDTANSTPVPTAGARSVWVGDFLQTYTPTIRCSSGASTTGAVLKVSYINRVNSISLFLSIGNIGTTCSGSLYLTLPQKAMATATGTAIIVDRASGTPLYGVIAPGATEVQIAPLSPGSIATTVIAEGGINYLYTP